MLIHLTEFFLNDGMIQPRLLILRFQIQTLLTSMGLVLDKRCPVSPLHFQRLTLLDLCTTSGIPVPEEVAILGVDNDMRLCRIASPPISSIDPNAKHIGYQAAFLLDAMMNGRELPELPIVVPPSHIVVRQSTDNIAVNDPILAKALRIMRDEVARNIRVNDVARELCVSRGTLNNLFRKHLNCTPLEEILRVRMEWAKELLRDTLIPVYQIAEMVGYRTSEYFSRAFMRENGVSPNAYRNVSRSKNKNVSLNQSLTQQENIYEP